MMFRFHPAAEDELNQAADYYEDQQTGLGLEFVEEVYLTIQRIVEFPQAWTSLSKKSRRCMTNRFPYQVIYSIREESILILAIGHLHRKPGYWQER
mgnify:CR=1 FL=1